MKKRILSLIMATLVFWGMFYNIDVVMAEDINCFNIVSISQGDYIVEELSIRNFQYETYNNVYVGQEVRALHPYYTIKYNGNVAFGSVTWGNKDYIIVDGYQELRLIFKPHFNKDEIIITIGVNPLPEIIPQPIVIDNRVDTKKPDRSERVDGFNFEDHMFQGYEGMTVTDIVKDLIFWSARERNVKGEIIYSDTNPLDVGYHEIAWTFTPTDERYEIEEGIYKIQINPKEEIESPKADVPTATSLTATTIQLDNKTDYDINLNDKVSGSTYLWSTDNTEIIEVNSKNGKIKAKKEGKAKVTCEITLPDGNVNILESLVTVGYDENAPLLTETILDLEVGNKFDINLENKIAKSKYRWTSSNRDIVKVNSSNGKVTAINVGEAYVTCTITIPKTNQVIVLRCDINVTE